MPVYQYEGQHFDLPDGLSNDDAIGKIKAHLGQSKSPSNGGEEAAYNKYAADFSKRFAAEQAMPIPGAPKPVVKSKQQWKEDNDARRMDDIAGIPDSALSIATGFLAQLPATAYGLGKGAMGQGAEKSYNEAVDALTYTPRTDRGKKIVEGLGNAMQVFGPNPYVVSTRAPKGAKAPKVDPVLANLGKLDEAEVPKVPEVKMPEQMELPLETSPQAIAEMRARGTNQMDLFASDTANRDVGGRLGETIPEPVLSAQKTHEFTKNLKQDEIDATPYGERPAQYGETDIGGRVDENGIPIRADLSMELANLENPLQRNLWGDELPRKSEQEAPVGITKALDSLPDTPFKGDARDVAMSQLRGQRGAIDLKSLEEGFTKFKNLANGNRLWAFAEGDGQLNVIAMNKDGEYIGGTRMSPEQYRNPKANDFMSSLSTDSFEKGMATEMYKFVAEMGNDIKPSNSQTNAGKAMWEGFERKGLASNKMIKGQRGGLDFQAIGDSITKAVKVLTPQERFVARALNDNSLIPKGDTPEQIVSKALTEQDGPKLATMLQSGLTQAGAKAKSTLMTGVARHLNWAEKVGDKYFRENVKPIEKAFSDLPKEQLLTVMQVMQKEMFNRKQYSPEQLRAAGLSEKQLAAYEKVRAEFDRVFELQNKSRVELGMEPVSKQAAYFASMWHGNHHLPIYGKDGTLKWYIKTETAGEARQAIEWFKKNGTDLDTANLKAQYKPQNTTLPRDVIGMYESMLEVFKDTPMAETIKSLMQDQNQLDAFTSHRHDVHFEKKANVRGFLGDRPWLSEKENGEAAAKAQVQYLKEAYRWVPLQEAMANIKKVLSNEELIAQQPNNMELTKLYVANTMGGTANMFRDFENNISKWTRSSPGTYNSYVASLKTLTYLQQLGLSTGYMIATPLQALILGPSMHRIMSKDGFKHNFIKSGANALVDTFGMLWQHQLEGYGANTKGKMSPIGKEALRYMEDNGIIDVSLFDEYAQLGAHKGVEALKQSIGVTIQFPEKIARVMTFMSFVHHLNDSGKLSKADLFRQAEEATNTTLTNFRKSSRPLIVDKTGMMGELLYTYKSPVFNYYNSLGQFAQHGKKTGDYMPLVMAGLIMPAMLGGVMNIPGASEMDGVFNLVKAGMAKFMPQHYSKIKDIKSPKELAMESLPNAVTYGAVSALTGSQQASRFSTGIVNPEDPLGGMVPAAGQVEKMGSAIPAMLNPNSTTIPQAMYDNSPPIARGLIETGMDTFKSGEPVVGADGEKRQLYFNANRLQDREASVERTAKDELYRRLGLIPLLESKNKEAIYRNNREDLRMKKVQDAMLTKTNDAIQRQVDPSEFIREYIMNGGEDTKIESSIEAGLVKANMTPEMRQEIKMKTRQQIDSVLRRRGLQGAN